jgi:hypothetical protein
MEPEADSPAGMPSTGHDWAADVADRIEQTVGNVRDRIVEPVRRLTRGVVFGTLAIGFAVPAAVMSVVLVFRLFVFLANLLPGPDDNTWMAWDLFGLLFVGAGVWLFAKRNARPTSGY